MVCFTSVGEKGRGRVPEGGTWTGCSPMVPSPSVKLFVPEAEGHGLAPVCPPSWARRKLVLAAATGSFFGSEIRGDSSVQLGLPWRRNHWGARGIQATGLREVTDVTSCCPGTEHAPSHSVLIPAGRSGHFHPILQTWTLRRREVNHLPTGHEAGEQRSWDSVQPWSPHTRPLPTLGCPQGVERKQS